MPGTVLSMQNIYLVKKNYANPLEGDTKPPEGDNSMKFVYRQLNILLQIRTKGYLSTQLADLLYNTVALIQPF